MSEFEFTDFEDNTELIQAPVDSFDIEDAAPISITISDVGVSGPPGPQNLHVGPDDPNMTSPGLWVQTFENGDFTFWIEDGQ